MSGDDEDDGYVSSVRILEMSSVSDGELEVSWHVPVVVIRGSVRQAVGEKRGRSLNIGGRPQPYGPALSEWGLSYEDVSLSHLEKQRKKHRRVGGGGLGERGGATNRLLDVAKYGEVRKGGR
jgi:hypothetical protein